MVVTAVLLVVGGTRAVFAGLLRPQYSRDRVLAGMHLLKQSEPAVVLETPPPPVEHDDHPTLEVIRDRGVLRVGYLPDALPFSFFNATGDLVGFDVDLAHRLAGELRVKLEFVPIERTRPSRRWTRSSCAPGTSPTAGWSSPASASRLPCRPSPR